MFLLNKIKYNADKNYDIYEEKIAKYYNSKNYKNVKNLEDYIYSFYIQSHIAIIFINNLDNIFTYIENLYLEYYYFYIKNIINDGRTYILTQEIIDKFLKVNYYKQHKTYNWIKNNSIINVPLDNYIKSIFIKKYNLPLYQYYGEIDRNDLYVFMAKMLDFIILDNMDKIILSIALGNI